MRQSCEERNEMRLLKLRIEDTDKKVGREKVWDLDKILSLKNIEGAFGTELKTLVADLEKPAPKVAPKKS